MNLRTPQPDKNVPSDKSWLLYLVLMLVSSGMNAQVVNDGATATLSNVTNNITGSVTAGTNGSFTLLVLADNALLTNSVHGVIGRNATAQSNEVQLISTSARWLMGNNLFVGSNGAFNRLVVSNGAFLNNSNGFLGNGASSSNNFALVTGSGSLWSNRADLTVGAFGPDNQLIVSNGARVVSRLGILGRREGSSNNLVVVTGSGSSWTNHLDVEVGVEGNGNRLVIEAGGQVGGGGGWVGESVGAGNEVLVTGPGSLWSLRTDLMVGLNPPNNRVVVSNGAAVVVGSNARMGVSSGATGNVVVVTGAGSWWSNQFELRVGDGSPGNRMEVNGGGRVVSSNTYVGFFPESSNNFALVTGAGSTWINRLNLNVGFNSAGNRLVVSNGGWAVSSNAFLGYASTASNNSAIVTGAGSVWSNRNDLTVGSNSPGNRIEVLDGGRMFVNGDTSVGRSSLSSSNSILVSGPGSVWSNAPGSSFVFGSLGFGNQLVVSNGARMQPASWNLGSGLSDNNQAIITGSGTLLKSGLLGVAGRANRISIGDGATFQPLSVSVGNNGSSRDNEMLVTGPGSSWRTDLLVLGTLSRGNRLVLTNGGEFRSVLTPGFIGPKGIIVGETSTSTNNRVVVHGGVLRAANANGDSMLDLRRGTNVFNAGLIDADVLLLTNPLSQFEFNGGTLITRGADIRNNAIFTVGNAGNIPAVWEVQPGASNHFVADSVVVGGVGSFAQLIHANGALLTNDGFASLGREVSSRSNIVTLTGPASRWLLSDGAIVGEGGSENRLFVSNGASLVTASISYLGQNITSSNNEAVVTGPGSSWFTADYGLRVGYEGSGNRLLVSDGGVVSSFDDEIGVSPSSSNNQVLVTGAGSLWNNTRELSVGLNSIGNQLVVSNGGTVFTTANKYVGQNDGALSNTALVTGPGSAWLGDDSLYVGADGSFNRLFVRNGGRVTSGIATLGGSFGADGNQALIADAGSVWSNRFDLNVGDGGSANQLVISNSGTILSASDGFIGRNSGASSNTAILTGVGTRWLLSSNLYVGSNGPFSQLVINNGARVENRVGFIGTGLSSSNNLVLVSGPGSLWTNAGNLDIGLNGSVNQLVVSNGGLVFNSGAGVLSRNTSSSNNTVVITGPGSFWRMSSQLHVGLSRGGNRLVLTHGGGLLNNGANIGVNGDDNEVLVTGAGSTWTNQGSVVVGTSGTRSRLVVNDGGMVFAPFDIRMGDNAASTNNRIVVDGGTLVMASPDLGVFDVRRGTNVLNAGLISVGRLLRVTNTLGRFEFNGGTLITHGASISNGQPFVVGRTGATPAIWDVRAGPNPHVLSSYIVIGEAAPFCQLLVTNGALLTGVEGVMGQNSGSDFNRAIVSGPGSRFDVRGDLNVGSIASFNTLVISNGAWVNTGFPVIGANPGSINNEAVVTGSNSLWTIQELSVGFGGAANRALVTDGGTVTVSNAVVVGALPGISSNNLLRVAGGALFVTNGAATGTLNIRSGTNRLDAGLIDVDRLVITNGRGEFEFNGGKFATRGTVVGHGRIFTVGNGAAAAMLELRGGTHVFLGGLVVTNHASLTGNGAVPGALTVQAGGTLAPGVSIGVLAFNIGPILQGATVMEIRKTGATLTNDQVQVAGTIAYGGSLTVTNLGPGALSAGDRFRLFIASGYSGSFNNLNLPPLAPGLAWRNDLAVDGSIQVVALSRPGFAGISLSGTNVVIAGTNGSANAFYTVLASTNVALPLSNWMSIATNQFDAAGHFNFTNPIVPGIPERFFLLLTP